MIVFDCGACIGAFFRNFLEHEVYAFEPLDRNAAYIRKRYPQVHLIEKAVTGRSGQQIKLYLSKDPKQAHRAGAQGSSIYAQKTNVNTETFLSVETVALSDFIRTLGKRVNLLKIDTEGSEFEIFDDLLQNGMVNEIDIIYYEDHRERHPAMFDLPWTEEVLTRLKAEFKGQLKQAAF
ncbi:FkbM family methyltransferase [Sulfidibacter corallicola]|uniref:FkbM family methyltransferase n=1 Tax=Sulfidibacter corallicola TaxID=2818388 RepID=A0A8A4TW58_SULCO|nr:FkbM family methyltransferase [Sulfidibacter corallicola]QTD53408.1 FkbM family methyltransferase [Sulfidibacter corallicola]